MTAFMLRRGFGRYAACLGVLAAAFCKPTLAVPTYSVTEVPSIPGTTATRFEVHSFNDSGQIVGKMTPQFTQEGRARSFLYSEGTTTDITFFTEGQRGDGRLSLNNNGEVAGNTFSSYGNNALLRRAAGTTTNLGTLGGTNATAQALNDQSVVVGESSVAGNTASHAFLWRDGVMSDLGTLGGASSRASDVNNSGVVVGESNIATTTSYALNHAFIYQNGVMRDLGTFGGSQSWANAVNDAGQVVGSSANRVNDYHAFLYSNGVMRDLTPYTTSGSASAINEAGHVIGNLYENVNGSMTLHGFVYGSDGLTQIIAPGPYVSQTSAINEAGQVVGWASDSSYQDYGYLYEKNTLFKLNSLVPDNAQSTLWNITRALKINNKGQVVALALREGQVRLVVLSPLPNAAPVANDDEVTTNEDQGTSILVLRNDSDPNRDGLTITNVTQGAHGTTSESLTAVGVIYTPEKDFNGQDTFTYTISDGNGGTATATVRVNVLAVNDAPVSSTQSVATGEDAAKNITLAATDVEGGALTYSIVSQPANGALTGNAPNLIYTPKSNYNGSDSFTFKANDGTGDSSAATVSIAVTPVNDVPVSSTQPVTLNEDTSQNITLSASDADGDSLTYSVVNTPSKGTLSGTAPNLVYTPFANANGSDSFTFTATDGTATTSVTTVSISITPINDAPVANTQSATVNEDAPQAIVFSASDADGDALSYHIGTQPAHGKLDGGGGATLTYTPAQNYNGPDSFQFQVSDSKGGQAVATMNITVAPVNDAPIALPNVLGTRRNSSATVTVTANDSDIDGDAFFVSSVTQGASGSVTFAGGNVTYTPKRNFVGTDSFRYTISDGNGGTSTANVSVTVTRQ